MYSRVAVSLFYASISLSYQTVPGYASILVKVSSSSVLGSCFDVSAKIIASDLGREIVREPAQRTVTL